MKKDESSLVDVKNITKKGSYKKKRNENDLDTKEVEQFKRIYPMVSNDILAKQFLISVSDVERLAYTHDLYKDPAFTRAQMSGSKGQHKTGDGSSASPGYLITAITKKMTEEERREIMVIYEEGVDPQEMMSELALAQAVRVQRGMALEAGKNEIWRAVNEAVDGLHNILKTLHEMENGQTTVHELGSTFESMIMRSKEAGWNP
jgi:hypothetical protein